MENLPRHLWTKSRSAAQLLITVDQFQKLADEMGVSQDLTIDDVHFYGIGKLNMMRSKLAEKPRS